MALIHVPSAGDILDPCHMHAPLSLSSPLCSKGPFVIEAFLNQPQKKKKKKKSPPSSTSSPVISSSLGAHHLLNGGHH